jgi:hypothetical protein
MVQVWTYGEDPKTLMSIVELLEKQAKEKADKRFRPFVIVVSEKDKIEATAKELTELTEKAKIEEVGVAYLPSDSRAVKQYKVNLVPEVKNTVIVYRRKKVTDKFVNLKADEKGLASLSEAIGKVTAD